MLTKMTKVSIWQFSFVPRENKKLFLPNSHRRISNIQRYQDSNTNNLVNVINHCEILSIMVGGDLKGVGGRKYEVFVWNNYWKWIIYLTDSQFMIIRLCLYLFQSAMNNFFDSSGGGQGNKNNPIMVSGCNSVALLAEPLGSFPG